MAATIAYNVVEAVVALTAGTIASSTALVGFGLDSVIEVSAAAVAWQFSARDHQVRQAREQRTLRIIAVSFFVLAAYVTADAARTLTGTRLKTLTSSFVTRCSARTRSGSRSACATFAASHAVSFSASCTEQTRNPRCSRI